MMGRLEQDQGQLFYSFCLEEVVPDDHQVRAIASVLDLSWVYGELSPHYPATRPPLDRSGSNDPDADPWLRLWPAVGAFALSRGQVNLAYRWFCGLSIEDKIPDHSVFSRARNERFRDNDIFRRVFERVVEACISAGLVGGEGVCGRCEPDRGRRQQAAVDPGQGMGSKSAILRPQAEL